MQLRLEIECERRDIGKAAKLVDGFRWMVENLYPTAIVRAQQVVYDADKDSIGRKGIVRPIPRYHEVKKRLSVQKE